MSDEGELLLRVTSRHGHTVQLVAMGDGIGVRVRTGTARFAFAALNREGALALRDALDRHLRGDA